MNLSNSEVSILIILSTVTFFILTFVVTSILNRRRNHKIEAELQELWKQGESEYWRCQDEMKNQTQNQ